MGEPLDPLSRYLIKTSESAWAPRINEKINEIYDDAMQYFVEKTLGASTKDITAEKQATWKYLTCRNHLGTLQIQKPESGALRRFVILCDTGARAELRAGRLALETLRAIDANVAKSPDFVKLSYANGFGWRRINDLVAVNVTAKAGKVVEPIYDYALPLHYANHRRIQEIDDCIAELEKEAVNQISSRCLWDEKIKLTTRVTNLWIRGHGLCSDPAMAASYHASKEAIPLPDMSREYSTKTVTLRSGASNT